MDIQAALYVEELDLTITLVTGVVWVIFTKLSLKV